MKVKFTEADNEELNSKPQVYADYLNFAENVNTGELALIAEVKGTAVICPLSLADLSDLIDKLVEAQNARVTKS